jgi:hypothetical protein
MLQAGSSRVRDPMRWILSIFQPHNGPVIDSPSNKNEYQESSWGVNGGRRVGLTILPPSVNRFFRENVGALTSENPVGLHGLLQGQIYLRVRIANLKKKINLCTHKPILLKEQ